MTVPRVEGLTRAQGNCIDHVKKRVTVLVQAQRMLLKMEVKLMMKSVSLHWTNGIHGFQMIQMMMYQNLIRYTNRLIIF